MTDSTLSVSCVDVTSAPLEEIFALALHDVHAKRGGSALLTTLCGGLDEAALLGHLVQTASIWTIEEGVELRGFGVVRGRIIESLYVEHKHRRQRVATALVRHLLNGTNPPVDAYALPGDRAMKSLFESLGWKARLLTMRGA